MQFDFGQNWVEFSTRALTPEKIEQARKDFLRLFSGVEVAGKTFLDIGFGQGLSLLIAAQEGARVFGNDVNPKCRQALSASAWVLGASADVPVVLGSILDPAVLASIREMNAPRNRFSIVHSWGVLHHTGDMKTAVRNAAALVENSGYLVLAIYNRHWSSPAWRLVKRAYCSSPQWARSVFIRAFFPVIALAKFLVTGKNPFRQSRGMDFYYNVVDWIGGYPYEFASRAELEAMVTQLGFSCVTFIPAEVPTGCNEFVFRRL